MAIILSLAIIIMHIVILYFQQNIAVPQNTCVYFTTNKNIELKGSYIKILNILENFSSACIKKVKKIHIEKDSTHILKMGLYL